MTTRLTYAIKYVADMNKAVAFHRDQLGLKLKFQSPEWSEFDTGATTLALHAASGANPAGCVELGFGVNDLVAFYRDKSEHGIQFVSAPEPMHGTKIATFVDSEGARTSISG